MTAQQPDQPQMMGPQPVQQQIEIQTIVAGGRSWVVLQIAGPTGTYVSFLDAEAVSTVAAHLDQAAVHARTGLIVAGALDGK